MWVRGDVGGWTVKKSGCVVGGGVLFLKIATEIVAAAVVNEMAAAAAQGLGFLISYVHFDPNPGSRFLTFFSYRDGEGV